MREIKFRGKRKLDDEWFFGSLLIDNPQNSVYIVDNDDGTICEVYKETVGQYTSLKDKNVKEIYEGDIYKKHNNTYLVIWTSHGFMWQTIYDNWLNKNIFSRAEKSWLSEIACKNFIEVIGNIHDNPELIHDQKAEVEHD
jgi:uncharacterized phage protein (TIGR01671 family)